MHSRKAGLLPLALALVVMVEVEALSVSTAAQGWRGCSWPGGG